MFDQYTLEFLAAMLHRPDGGFTVRPDGTHAVSGYAVSTHPQCELVIPQGLGSPDAVDLELYTEKYRAELSQPGAVFGGWHDPETDNVHLDVSRVVDTARAAYVLACNHGQLAYFDLARGVSVPVTDIRVHPAA